MAVKTKNGIILRNPNETAKRYARQLKNGKVAETGKKLTGSDKAFRAGYLKARADNAKAYNSNHGIVVSSSQGQAVENKNVRKRKRKQYKRSNVSSIFNL